MFKEVGASGQISLGKKYAGRMFDMSLAADGRITLVPVQVVPMVQETQASYAVGCHCCQPGLGAVPCTRYCRLQRLGCRARALRPACTPLA